MRHRSDDGARCAGGRCTASEGRIDFLINNAVVYGDNGLASSRGEWLQALDVNLVSGAMLVQKTADALAAQGGAIVNMGSVGGKFGAAGRALYPAAKAAILQLTRNQAASLAHRRVRVNSVSPGLDLVGRALAHGGWRPRATRTAWLRRCIRWAARATATTWRRWCCSCARTPRAS
jgi:NAD(P)-dependent dehydrogenase (short-subunit alcohol dehydrogenase family)